MKLAEALMARNDLKSKMDRVKEETLSVLITEEGAENEFNASDKLATYFQLSEQLNELNILIDKANKQNVEKLQLLRKLDKDIAMLNGVRGKLLSYEKRRTSLYGTIEPVIMKKNVQLISITEMLEKAEEDRRKTDRGLQATNWQIEV